LAARSRGIGLAGAIPWQALTAAILAAGLGIGLFVPLPDISWLSVAAERILHGERLYTQVLEVNPPLSVLLYAPAVLLADLSGLTPETVTAGLCILGVVVSLALSGAILNPLIRHDQVRQWKLAAAGAFVLCLMPLSAFAQREHIAVMALLPFLAIAILRAEGRSPTWQLAIFAGLGLGLAVAIKPHFAAIAIFPALWAMWRTGKFRPYAQPELWAAALVVGGYVLTVLIWFPTFLTDFVPVVLDAYLPIRTPFWQLLILPGIPLALGAAIVARLMRLEGRWLAVPLLAALGGAVAFLVQGKGWPYHAYPMLAFAALGLLGPAAMTPPARVRAWRVIDRSMLLIPSLCAMVWLSGGIVPGPLAGAVAAVAPPSPRLIGVSGVGLTLVRALHAHWVGSECMEWISDGALRREQTERLAPAQQARLDSLIDAERKRLGQDIRAGRPDVILFVRKPFDWRAWSLKDPKITEALGHYRLATTMQGVEVWIRTSH
jgi:hypothetical protein